MLGPAGVGDSVDNFMNNYRKKLKFHNTPGVRREVLPTNVSVKLKTKAPQHIREGFGSGFVPSLLKILSQEAIEPSRLKFFRPNSRLHQDPDGSR